MEECKGHILPVKICCANYLQQGGKWYGKCRRCCGNIGGLSDCFGNRRNGTEGRMAGQFYLAGSDGYDRHLRDKLHAGNAADSGGGGHQSVYYFDIRSPWISWGCGTLWDSFLQNFVRYSQKSFFYENAIDKHFICAIIQFTTQEILRGISFHDHVVWHREVLPIISLSRNRKIYHKRRRFYWTESMAICFIASALSFGIF